MPSSLYPIQAQNMISQEDLDRLKVDILSKINHRFLNVDNNSLDDKEKKSKVREKAPEEIYSKIIKQERE